MQILTITSKTSADGYLHLELPTQLKSRQVELVLIMTEATRKKARTTKTIFADLAGRLQWRGDAVKAQRALRNEW